MGLATFFQRVFQSNEMVDPMVDLQYQTMVGVAQRQLPPEELMRPELIAARTNFRKIEAIETAFDDRMSERLLTPFLTGNDPWLCARAAKALYASKPAIALQALKRLVRQKSSLYQLPAVWALGELSTARSLEILMSVAWSPHPEVQQVVLRYMIKLESKKQIPTALGVSFEKLLKDVRAKSDWIL